MNFSKKAIGFITGLLIAVSTFGPASSLYMSHVDAAVGGKLISEKEYQRMYMNQVKATEKYGYVGNSTGYSTRISTINKALINTTLDEVIKKSQVKIDKQTFELMCRVVQEEAGPVSYETRELLAEVIVHRGLDSAFPSNIHDVLYAPKQFTCVHGSAINRVRVDGITINAVKDALLECQHPQKVLFFRARYYFAGLKPYKSMDGTYFSYGRY
ncbi:MAG: cell wall hydrolase [Lachnospiraceae bacterium]|nr:cell wall hydrolase [Lachnospiraceae bacterium]